MKRPPPPPRVIAIDVDGTLISASGAIHDRVAEFAKEKVLEGFEVWLWSSRGEAHARRAAELAGITDILTHILSKPGYIVDDQGWGWTRYTRTITDPEEL